MNAALLSRRDRLPTVGLVALYDFVQGPDPQALYDRSGNGFHGTLGGSPGADSADPIWTPQGLQFDGVDDLVLLPNLPGSSGAVTFIFTLPNPPASGVATIYSQSNQSASTGYYWIYRATGAGAVTFQYSKGNGFVTVSAAAPWATGDLWAIVADYSGQSLRFFRNGELVSGGTMDTPQLPPPASSRIGRYFSGTQGAQGLFSLFARYDRAMSDGEIARATRTLRRLLARRGVALP